MNLKQITADLRQRIVFGEFSPGDILPRRSELVAHYDSSVASFQKCINQLIQEGFLESCGSKGTIVCENLPNRFQIGLVVPVRPDSTARIWDPFWELLLKAADEFQAADPRYRFEQADICDRRALDRIFTDFRPDERLSARDFTFTPPKGTEVEDHRNDGSAPGSVLLK